jgi:uncharacterized glyoxalase superfamily protein PhnB
VSVQPEIWVERPATAVFFYERAFGARVLHRVGDGEDIVAQFAVGEGAFWVGSTAEGMGGDSVQAPSEEERAASS